MSSIEDRVAEIVAQQLGIERSEITSDSPFVTDLGCDSLDQECLIIDFEQSFSVRFPPGSAEQVQSIREVVELIERCRAA